MQTRTLASVPPTPSASPSFAALNARIEELEAQLKANPPPTPPLPLPHPAAQISQPAHHEEEAGWYRDVSAIPKDATVFVTFVNGDEKYRELMINWALHLRVVRVPHVVVAFDDVAAAVCGEHGIPVMRCAHFAPTRCTGHPVAMAMPPWRTPLH